MSSAQGRASRHTLSKASEIFAGNIVNAGHLSGRIGAPLDNAVLRFIAPGVPVKGAATVLAATAITTDGYSVGVNVGVGTMHDGIVLGRKITLTSSGNDSAVTATIKGSDGSGRYQEEDITLGNAGLVTSVKMWSRVIILDVSEDSAGTVSIGTVDIFEPPYRLVAKSQISEIKKTDTVIASLPGKLTVGLVTAQTASSVSPKGAIDLSAESLTDMQSLTIDMMVFRGGNDEALGLPAFEG